MLISLTIFDCFHFSNIFNLLFRFSDEFKNIIIDLEDTRYCDSSGLTAILVANRLCKNAGGSFILCSLQRSVSKLISISQLDTILSITPTLQEAVDLVAMETIEKDLGEE